MTLGVIGCGKMATALVEGLCAQTQQPFDQMRFYNRTSATAETLARRVADQGLQSSSVETITQLVSESEVVLLGVKPPQIKEVLQQAPEWGAGTLLISIAAGISLQSLEDESSPQTRIARVMPNTPCLIGEGASAFCLNAAATPEDRQLVTTLLSCVGQATEVAESAMNAVTGLSGSGPAYIYTIIEALSDAGVHQGLSRQTALSLAVQTVKGAAMMVEQSGLHPAVLRDAVTSPGGTTITGLASLEEHGIRTALASAVQGAAQKAKELGA